jgi:hypothetical protein
MEDQNIIIITLATTEELKKTSYYNRLWMAVRSISISRRSWLDEISDTFRDFDGIVLQPNGNVYDIPLVDDVFANDFDMRWLSYYLRPDETGKTPRSRSYKIKRLQLFDLYFKIKYPKIARHFGR